MEAVVLKTLLIATVSAQFGKHVYVPDALEWNKAQDYCRSYHTDLSPIDAEEEKKLKIATIGKVDKSFWTGLYKNSSVWKWSGGETARNIQWLRNHTYGFSDRIAGALCWHNCSIGTGWRKAWYSYKLPFFCFNLIFIKTEVTWEEAALYCRQTHTALISLGSVTEGLLSVRKIKHSTTDEQVWIGLRYMGDQWYWVDGNPSTLFALYMNQQSYTCPKRKFCGVLTRMGRLKDWDCWDKLSFICY